MAATVTNDPPGRIGPVGAGWTIELDAMPHNPTQSAPSSGVASFTAVSTAESHLAMNNNSQFDFLDDQVNDALQNVTVSGTTWSDPDQTSSYGSGGYGSGGYSGGTVTSTVLHFPAVQDGVVSASVTGSIDSVSLQGETSTYTQGTQFTQFTRADSKVPAVSSGSPLASVVLAWQLAGKNPCTYSDIPGIYWSLRGHDSGFDYQNKLVTPVDRSAHKILADKTVYRQWNVQKSYASTSWAVHDGDIWSSGGVGSSLDLTPGLRNLIIGTTILDDPSRPFAFQYGSTLPNWGQGPNSRTDDLGKWFNISITRTGIALRGSYYSGGAAVNISKSAPLTGVDVDAPIQFAISIGFQSKNVFTITVYVCNFPDGDTAVTPVVLASGLLSTGHDLSSAPWSHSGYLQDLYVTTGDRATGPSVTTYLGDYADWGQYPACDLDNLGIGAPILAYSGTIWDYLGQVCVARQVDLRLVGGQFALSAMNENGAMANTWTPAASPTFSIDNSTSATSVQIESKFTSFSPAPVIYDGQRDTTSYSMTPGTTTTFTITTTSVNALVYNPTPVDTFDSYLHTVHPWGAYMVSGPDNLPILSSEWISYGGHLGVEQTDQNTLTISVVCPIIPLGTSNDSSNYSIGVSDGSTTYSLLKLVSVAGGASVAKTATYQTGASYVGSNSSASSVQNVAATDAQSLANLAAWAVAEAAGPHITLSGQFPISDLRRWHQGSDFGVVPGSTIIYRNVQWRILTATLSNVGVSFTAEPYTVYSSEAWALNWDDATVDDYATFWEGKTYDDMATMVLAGPLYDWGSAGAVSKFTLYPSAGQSLALDLGLDPSTTLLPSLTLDPDAPTSLSAGTLPATWPEGSEIFPGSEEE